MRELGKFDLLRVGQVGGKLERGAFLGDVTLTHDNVSAGDFTIIGVFGSVKVKAMFHGMD